MINPFSPEPQVLSPLAPSDVEDVDRAWTLATKKNKAKPDYKRLGQELGLNGKLVCVFPPADQDEMLQRYTSEFYKNFDAGAGKTANDLQNCLAKALALGSFHCLDNKYSETSVAASFIHDLIASSLGASGLFSHGMTTLTAETGFSLTITIGGESMLMTNLPVVSETLEESREMVRFSNSCGRSKQCVVLKLAEVGSPTPLHAGVAVCVKGDGILCRDDEGEWLASEDDFIEMLTVELFLCKAANNEELTIADSYANSVMEMGHRAEVHDFANTDDKTDDDTSAGILSAMSSVSEKSTDPVDILTDSIMKNADFLSQVPALAGNHKQLLESCGLEPKELLERQDAADAISTEMADLARQALAVYKEGVQLISARRADLTKLIKVECKYAAQTKGGAAASAQQLQILAKDALEQLKATQSFSTTLRTELQKLIDDAAGLQKLCSIEAVIVSNSLGQKEDAWKLLHEDLERKQGLLAQLVENFRQAQMEGSPLFEIKRRISETSAQLASLRNTKKVMQERMLSAAGQSLLTGGAFYVGLTCVMGVALSPLLIAGPAGFLGAVSSVSTLLADSALKKEHKRLEAVEERAQEQVAELQQRAQEMQLDVMDLERQVAELNRHLEVLSERQETIGKHMETLEQFKKAYTCIATHLQGVEDHGNFVLQLMAFFDTKGLAGIAGLSDGEDFGLEAYIIGNLTKSVFKNWVDSLDKLEVANSELAGAVQRALRG